MWKGRKERRVGFHKKQIIWGCDKRHTQ